MSELDKELLRRKLEYLREYLDKLKEFSSMQEAVFLGDHHNYGLAEHYLQQSIEVILDICRHIVIALELKTPEDSRALFGLLAGAGVLPTEFAQNNSNMSGFRNRLVHEYAEIDHKKVYEYLINYFPELEKFITIVSSYALK